MKVAVVTGTRAEYGIWRPVLRALAGSEKLHLQLVVTGMHLLREFGHTLDDILADPWPVAAQVPMYRRGASYAQSLARGTRGLARAFETLQSDAVLLLGDRLEMLAAAQAAMCTHRMIAHLHGGERAAGLFDEQIRHAITKMAHWHFPATAEAGDRICRMGEDPGKVWVVGAPALDELTRFLARRGRGMPGGIPAGRSVRPLLVLHPTSPDEALEYQRAGMVVRVLRDFFGELQVVGPNNDPGHAGILAAYREAGLSFPMSLRQEAFWELLASSGLLVGNSSSGILEAASFPVPVINLGDRQAGRLRSGNVLDAPFEPSALQAALVQVTEDGTRFVLNVKNVYGQGRAAEAICSHLEALAGERPVTAKLFFERG